MTPVPITLGDGPLTLAQLDPLLGRPLAVTLAPAGLARAVRARGWVEQLVQRDEAVYGVNTGFGHLKNKRIPAEQLDQLQENLILSHAVGVGPPTPPEIVRWMLLFKVQMLLRGHSGVRPEVIERLVAWLSADLLPVVPSRGSLGASGDRAPLAHLFLPLLGRGEMWDHNEIAVGRSPRAAGELQAGLGLAPLRLAAKEGLALINGTQFMAAYAANIGVRARRLLDLADLICCMSFEGLRGTDRHVEERLHAVRPHPGALRSAANIRRHMQHSEIRESHADCDRVQDPYSLRCAPQVHGAIRDALEHFCDVLERELDSVTDNPILFGDETTEPRSHAATKSKPANGASESKTQNPKSKIAVEAISGGHFHGEPLALILDYLAIALTDLGNIAERRVYLLLSGLDGLPLLLMRDTGLNSGFMLPQYTAAALINECKVLATPASVDSIPTSLGQEDHVSMGATSAVKCYEILDRIEIVLSIELMCAAQALDYRAALRAGVGPRAALAVVRQEITHAEADRQFGEDIAAAIRLLRDSEDLRNIARGHVSAAPHREALRAARAT